MHTISVKYDLQQTCRSCLRQSKEMISLNVPHEENACTEFTFSIHKTTGEVMMECANVEVNNFRIINRAFHLNFLNMYAMYPIRRLNRVMDYHSMCAGNVFLSCESLSPTRKGAKTAIINYVIIFASIHVALKLN